MAKPPITSEAQVLLAHLKEYKKEEGGGWTGTIYFGAQIRDYISFLCVCVCFFPHKVVGGVMGGGIVVVVCQKNLSLAHEKNPCDS